MKMLLPLYSLCLASLLPILAHAQSFTSGTGFFVSKAGHIITNEHVVRGCDTVRIRGAVEPTEAKVIKTDAAIDLALLKTRTTAPRVAPIRAGSIPVRKGERLMVIGYPEDHARTGIYDVTQSRVIDMQGPLGGDQWVQFEDSARQGNSGGPLFDSSGNVIGVIMGKGQLMRTNPINGRTERISTSDLAINLPYLWNFIEGEGVYTVTQNSALQHGNGYLERMASETIVNIHCLD